MTDLTAGGPAEVDGQQPELDVVDEQLIDRHHFSQQAQPVGPRPAG